MGLSPLQATEDQTETQDVRPGSQGVQCFPGGPWQDLLGWAQPSDSGEPGGGQAEYGSTQQASLETAAGSW